MVLEEAQQNLRDSPIPVADLADGRSVLIRGPAMSGKYELLLALLSRLATQSVLVSTSRQVDSARADFATVNEAGQLAIVDCTSHTRGRNSEGGELVRYASSPQNLTEIGVKFTDLIDSIEDDGTAAVGLHSVSELLMYADIEQVYQFIKALLGECRGVDWPAVAVVDNAAVEEQTVNTLTGAFDAVINTRSGAERALQYFDPMGQETEWHAF